MNQEQDHNQGALPGADTKKLHGRLRESISACKQYRRRRVKDWQINVDYRRGKPFSSETDEDRISVPMDWALTKEKEAQLFSQVPAVRVNHPPHTIAPDALPWLHNFETKVNDVVITAGIESAMNECLPDCINASGVGVVIVAREAITENVLLPSIDLSLFPEEIERFALESGTFPDGTPIPMEETPRVLDSRYLVSRISPADFLWPVDFTGSDFDMSPWVGRSGRVLWPEAINRFNLKEEEKEKVLGDNRSTSDRIDRQNQDQEKGLDEVVSFDEIFYREICYIPGTKSFSTIHHLVFIDGRDAPVIDEPWKGQKIDKESGLVIGALRYPIRVLTLAYLTDDAIPPSDSSIGRPQVDEINKARTQRSKQQERSIPVRWFDVNRVDPAIQYSLMRGTWQGMIPVQGVGSNIIGEVARSGMPQETFLFDRIAQSNLKEFWQVGAGQWGPGVETKAEVEAIGSSTDIRIARERAKVGKFFIGIAEVLGGLVSIFEDPNAFGQGFTPLISRALAYSILADSTVLLDSNQRLRRLIQFVNFTATSGWVDIEPVLKEIASLSGLDPSVVIRPPQPKAPVEPNMSLRLTGTEDMMNPLTLAFLMKSGQAPDIAMIEEAKKLIEAAVTPPAQPPGLDGIPGDIALGPRPLDGQVPGPPVPEIGAANPEWRAMNRVNSRVVEREK